MYVTANHYYLTETYSLALINATELNENMKIRTIDPSCNSYEYTNLN